jgi:RNA recognition motif-containing protein
VKIFVGFSFQQHLLGQKYKKEYPPSDLPIPLQALMPESSSLRVFGMSKNVTRVELRAFFTNKYDLIDIRIGKKHCDVRFANEILSKLAQAEFNGKIFKGRTIRCALSSEKKAECDDQEMKPQKLSSLRNKKTKRRNDKKQRKLIESGMDIQ